MYNSRNYNSHNYNSRNYNIMQLYINLKIIDKKNLYDNKIYLMIQIYNLKKNYVNHNKII